ncbi:MAG: hypothetical protein H0V55_09290 [Thermoleophilaceae bacterium]|nr:hypothetical protein [Thermoleophilaceae bacterium]
MSESASRRGPSSEPVAEVRHLPVPAPERPSNGAAPALMSEVLEPAGPRTVAAVQAPSLPVPLLAAAGGFLVGVLTWAVASLLRPRRRRVAVGRLRRRERSLEIAGTRSFLVDVHLIRR